MPVAWLSTRARTTVPLNWDAVGAAMVAGSTENKHVATQTGRHEGRERHRRTGVVSARCDRYIVSTVILIFRRQQVVLYRTPAEFCFSLTQHGRGTRASQLLLLGPLLYPPAATGYFLALRCCGVELVICVILTLLGYLPGVLYALRMRDCS